MNPTFRVEAFIVPVLNRNNKNDDNIIDDVKVANKLRNIIALPDNTESVVCVENDKYKESDFEIDENNEIKSCITNSNICIPTIKINLVDFNDEKAENEENNEQQPQDVVENKEIDKIIVEQNDNEVISERNIDVEPIYDVPYPLMNINKFQSAKLRERFETDEYVTMKSIPKDSLKSEKVLMRTSSLMSIDERGETPDDYTDEFCCHGYKNGCTAATQRPEAVTEEVFEINWMKRLEQLRAKEAHIREKELALFDRERLLFKKERELRILERLIKDKLKHAELYLKRCKLKNADTIDCDSVSKISEQSKDSQPQSSKNNGTSVERLSSIESLESCHRIESGLINNKHISNELIIREALKSNGLSNTKACLSDEKILRNPPNSRSSLITSVSGQYEASKSDIASSYLTNRDVNTRMSGYSSLRIKKRPKITYDDLDSTLSADIGDSSFVITSKKFNPEIFKKPYAFTRSCSERRHSKISVDNPSGLSAPIADIDAHNIEEDKLLKRISENILISHDKNTKFQHYGMIDNKNHQFDVNTDGDDKRRHSYLNLEDGKKNKKNQCKSIDKKIGNKERPISWNEETNEWLQKKRQAYNLQTAKKILTANINENKENHSSDLKLIQTQKKISKAKKFSIFR